MDVFIASALDMVSAAIDCALLLMSSVLLMSVKRQAGDFSWCRRAAIVVVLPLQVFQRRVLMLHGQADEASPETGHGTGTRPSRGTVLAFARGALDASYTYPYDSPESMALADRRPLNLSILSGYEEAEEAKYSSGSQYPVMSAGDAQTLIRARRARKVEADGARAAEGATRRTKPRSSEFQQPSSSGSCNGVPKTPPATVIKDDSPECPSVAKPDV